MPVLSRGGCELTLAEIARLTNSKLLTDQTQRCIADFAPLELAGPADIAFLDDERNLHELACADAGACFLPPRFAASAPPRIALLVNEEPYRAFVIAARALFPDALRPSSLFATIGRAAGAHVHDSARIEAGVTVDPLALIGPGAEVGAGTLIGAGAALGPDVCVGRRCAIGAGASIMRALIGDDVIIHPGVRIGQDGLGYRADAKASEKLPQTRRVIIQDGAEIGANATIDCGSTRDTVVGEGTKIDNLVQIAHNVLIGRRCFIGAQTGIAGGVKVGDFAIIGAQVAIAGNVAIGDGAKLADRSVVHVDAARGERSLRSAARRGDRR